MKTFGERIKEARKRMGLSQEELADALKVARPVISSWETNEKAASPDRAVTAAEKLGEDPKEFLLLSILQDVTATGTNNVSIEQTLNDLLSRLLPSKTMHSAGLASHLSLCDFPQGFHEPFTIVVGDKRETPPKTVGDLAAFSASTVDDRWVHKLGLPRSTEKIPDKVFVMATEEWLRKRLGKSTIISIGSPASNIFTRFFNHKFLFRFAPNLEIKTEWEVIRKQVSDLNRDDCPPAELEKFNREHGAKFKWLMREFKRPGFIDFNFEYLHLGFIGADNKDFAVISIGMNPFSDASDPRFAILVAGAQYPGTALALQKLSDPSFFKPRPFGGILEADVPRPDISARKVFWWDKIENSSVDWHHAGQTGLSYSPASLRNKLSEWSERISKGSLIPQITHEEIEDHIKLIDALAK